MNTYPYRTYAEIDLNKMQHNLQQVRAAIGPDCKLLFCAQGGRLWPRHARVRKIQ